jgi:hypothetical protein
VTATDSELYRAFAGRVRTTVATTPEGSPTMNDTTTVETGEVPATFQASPDTACGRAWCVETGAHVEHVGRMVNLPEVSAQIWQDTDDAQPTIVVGNPQDDYQSFTSGQQLRERAAQIRGGSARLDALADEYDALREAVGEAVADVTLQPELVPPAAEDTPTGTPRTWSFVNKDSGVRETYTCMLGCTVDHTPHQTRPQAPEEVSCRVNDYGPDLPMEVGRDKQPVEVLYLVTRYQPWALSMGRRMPHVTVEVVDDHLIHELDPDGLQAVIDTFQSRVDAMRDARLHLIAARAQWLQQQRDGGTR